MSCLFLSSFSLWSNHPLVLTIENRILKPKLYNNIPHYNWAFQNIRMLAGTLSLHNTEIDSIQWIMLLIREITFRADHKNVSSCNQNSRLYLTSDFSLHWILERKWEESRSHKILIETLSCKWNEFLLDFYWL